MSTKAKEASEEETHALVHVGQLQPMLVQRRKSLGCFFIIALIVVTIAVIGLALGLGIGLRSKQTSLPQEIKISNLMAHLKDLQTIADEHNGSRSVKNGYMDSARMVMKKLEKAGYEPLQQNFTVALYENFGNSSFSATVPGINFTWHFLLGSQFAVMRYSQSPSDAIVASMQPIDGGCDPSDFDHSNNSVALVNYTTVEECSLFDKVNYAKQAGAVAVVMMRNESDASLGPPTSRIYNQTASGFQVLNITVLGATYQLGLDLLSLFSLANANLTVEIQTATSVTMHDTCNVLACTNEGKEGSIIVMGSHLDSVPAGPGINDNGSGSMANLEIAIQLARLKITPKNKVLFAFWGAEELGLLGSYHYFMNLSEEEKANIALNLNFDMIGSPNYARLIYNGSMADEPIVNGSTRIQSLFEERFRSQHLAYDLTPFNGRSDYGAFIEGGIPAGGLFTGAEELKSEEQRVDYGGFANAQLDPCYHQACDTVDNINQGVYEQMAQAAAYVMDTLMMKDNLREFLNS